MISDDSDDSEPNGPIVSDLIHLFIIPVALQNIHTSVTVHQGALIDLGCTHCLIHMAVVDSLGIHTLNLGTPIWFEQIDGSMLGGTPVTHVIELIQLEIGEHREDIHFIVVERMVKPIILGLAWWTNGSPPFGGRADSKNCI